MINKEFNPFPMLETTRLILKKVDTEHLDQLFELLSNPEVAKFDYFYPVTSIKEVIKFIDRYREEVEKSEEITWAIVLKETNKLIGTCCLGDFDEYARRSEIGYSII
jgi:[ribosomal protein S5]-alanine N-acetyltransferase